jgi:acetyl esterase/lipase
MSRILLGSVALAVLVGGLFACAPLTAFNTLAPHDGGAHRVVTSAAYGQGPRRTLDLYAPAEKNAPVIVFFYGGSWSGGKKSDYSFAADALASCGFMVAVPDYRLVPAVRYPAFLQDGAAAIAWVRANAARHGGDPDRIVLAGHSAGAYIAVMLALDRDYLAKANVPDTAIKGAGGISGPYDFYPFDVKASIDAFGQAPDPQATQPITYARADAPPLLLVYGDKDTTVKPRNTLALAAKLGALGASVEAKAYPGLDHVTPMLAMSVPFRGKAPVREDICAFARRVTAK